MKKLFWIAVAALCWIYGSGFMSLGESGAVKYLNKWEELSLNGDAGALCEMMHEDLEFTIDDRSTPGQPLNLAGGKAELCDYFSQVVPAMKHIVSGMNVTRNDMTVQRAWSHPWTAEVTYVELRTVSMSAINMNVTTTGEDQITLVKTLTGGVKIKSLHAKTRIARPA
jgi:hypothetical protein